MEETITTNTTSFGNSILVGPGDTLKMPGTITSGYYDYPSRPYFGTRMSDEDLYKYQEIIFNSDIDSENKIKLIGLLERLNH